MYCKVCGKEINDKAYVCIHCGAKVAEDAPQSTSTNKNPCHSYAIAALVCSFLMPLLGLIFGIIGYSKSKEVDEEAKNMSVGAIFLSSLFMFLCILLPIVLIY